MEKESNEIVFSVNKNQENVEKRIKELERRLTLVQVKIQLLVFSNLSLRLNLI